MIYISDIIKKKRRNMPVHELCKKLSIEEIHIRYIEGKYNGLNKFAIHVINNLDKVRNFKETDSIMRDNTRIKQSLIKLIIFFKITKEDYQSMNTIYFLQCNNLVKIGTTQDIKSRLYALSQANPYEVKLIGTIPGGRNLEKKLHERFKAYQYRGEWFYLCDSILNYIKKEYQNE